MVTRDVAGSCLALTQLFLTILKMRNTSHALCGSSTMDHILIRANAPSTWIMRANSSRARSSALEARLHASSAESGTGTRSDHFSKNLKRCETRYQSMPRNEHGWGSD